MIASLLRFVDDAALVRRYHVLAVSSAVARALVVLLLVPTLSRLFSDTASDAWPWIGGLAVAVVAGWWIDQRYAAAGFDVGFVLLGSVEQRVLSHLERIPLPAMTPRIETSAQRAVTSAGQELCSSFAYVVSPLYSTVMSTVLIAIGLLVVDVPLGLTALTAAALLGLAMLGSNRLLRASERRHDDASARVGEQVVEFAQAQHVLRAAGRARDGAGLDAALAEHRRAGVRMIAASAPGQALFVIVSQVALFALAVVAVLQVRADALDAPEVAALVVVAVRFLDPFFGIADLAPALEIVRGALDRIDAVLAVPTLATATATPGSARGHEAAVELRDVSFGYPTGPDVLSGVDLRVEHGRTVAIVGPSGSGKSTLLALVARFADVTHGQVLVDGRDVRAMPPQDLTDRIAVVFQHVYLADVPLVENVRIARPEATDAEVEAAARAARLDEVVERLPDGWQTRVGEGGRLLSGGERQRVSVARALLKQAPILLLDEATSAIDARNEAAVVAALEAGSTERATVVVAHRLTTIARADEICFLEDGRVVERGTVRELLDAGGRFADYWHQRQSAADWVLR